jgi:protein-S-isoprenylcysteine O-methyltransferase Ste14
MNTVFVVVYAVWFISEVLLGRLRRSNDKDQKRDDRHSLLVIWLVIAFSMPLASVLSKSVYAPIAGNEWITYAGLGLIMFGIVFRFWVIRSLGKFFTVDVAIREGHQLKIDGIYSVVRHPSYLASWLSFVGYGISLNNWLSLLLIGSAILAAFLNKIRVEEDVLMRQFGEQYKRYRGTTKAIIPGVY